MKFSICIPNYNYGQYIGDTIRSVLEQDFNDFEIIISDNNSTDKSWKIIEDYALKDNRIVVHQNKVNIGFSGNLDLVSSHASSEYQILVSSDDLINQGALNFYQRFVEQCGSDKIIFSSSCLRIDFVNIVCTPPLPITHHVDKSFTFSAENSHVNCHLYIHE
jgi:glycosyltransferase involved in cell wall biosynthesis